MRFSAVISDGAIINNSEIGEYSYVGKFSMLESVVIGRYCSLGNHLQIGGYEHAHWFYSTSHHLSRKGIVGVSTTIDHDVWIGSGVFVKQGVHIGIGAVIAAGAAVVSDVPPFAIVGGVPAKLIKFRFSDVVCQKIIQSEYWTYPKDKAAQILNELWCAEGNGDA